MTGGVYFVTDPAAGAVECQALSAARAGVAFVQLRDKSASDDDMIRLARALKTGLATYGTRLIVNDRVDVAIAAGADGVHMGQGDGDPRHARARIGPGLILGLSIERQEQLARVPEGCVDYLGVGPVRATPTKPGHAPPMGFAGLRRIASGTALPCIAIGGLGPGDARACRRAGAAGMAVVSAIARSDDPEGAARHLRSEWSAP